MYSLMAVSLLILVMLLIMMLLLVAPGISCQLYPSLVGFKFEMGDVIRDLIRHIVHDPLWHWMGDWHIVVIHPTGSEGRPQLRHDLIVRVCHRVSGDHHQLVISAIQDDDDGDDGDPPSSSLVQQRETLGAVSLLPDSRFCWFTSRLQRSNHHMSRCCVGQELSCWNSRW